MGKRLILAVAGSGKTSYLISQLNLDHRFLLVTYTINNYEHLRNSILKKFGYYPENIKVLKYFQFLYSFCFKPLYGLIQKTRGITFDIPPDWTRYKSGQEVFYKTKTGRLYANRLAHFCKEQCANDIKERLDKYYDYFFVDEVQDIAGHDFNLLLSIIPDSCSSLFVGDFFQHTFDTSRDGVVNKSLYDNYKQFVRKWELANVEIDTKSLAKTHRCSKDVCGFVSQLGIAIESTEMAKGCVSYVDDEQMCDELMCDSNIPKLFYQDSSKYACASMNWGESKGLDHFNDVCVVLNKTTCDLFLKGRLEDLSAQTRNKLYVACTRAHRHLYIMSCKYLEKYKKT